MKNLGTRLVCTKSLQSCLTLCDPRDCRPPGSSVHGILQARTLGQVAISCSRRSSQSRDQTPDSHLLRWQACSSPLALPEKHSRVKIRERAFVDRALFCRPFASAGDMPTPHVPSRLGFSFTLLV